MTTRPFLWSVRREVWENRSISLAPLGVAALVLFGFTVSAFVRLPARVRDLATLDAHRQHAVLAQPYGFGASAILFASFVVALFYCVDALYGERRDRTILFWKSLPVSDRTTVLAKVAVACGVVPAVACAVALATQLLMLAASTLALTASGVGAGAYWSRLPLLGMPVVMVYGLAAHVLWFAPLYAWLLFVSGWARRTPILWAVLPPVGVMAMEHLLFGSRSVSMWVGYRFNGALREAFVPEAQKKGAVLDQLSQMDPVRFLGSAGLWTGLAIAAGLIVLAVRLRRYREPI